MTRSLFSRKENTLYNLRKRRFPIKETQSAKPDILPFMRIIAILCLIADKKSFKEVDELCEVFRTSARETFHGFLEENKCCFGEEYLCPSNEKDLKTNFEIIATRALPGCAGSWDC